MSSSVMFLSNDFLEDPRVRAEAEALCRAGWQVTVLAWNRAGVDRTFEWKPGITIQWIGVKSGVGIGITQIFRIPLFWWRAVLAGLRTKATILHAHDFDTLPAAWLVSALKGLPLLYDAHESYPDQHVLRLPPLLVSLMRSVENLLIRRVDAMITVGARLARMFSRTARVPVEIVGNWKDRAEFSFAPDVVTAYREKHRVNGYSLLIGYAGGMFPQRNVLPLIEAVSQRPHVGLLLAGAGGQAEAVRQAAAATTNVRYLGSIPAEEIALFTVVTDAVYYCLDAAVPLSHYSAPNKLFEAMAAGKAIIAVSKLGEIGDIVEERNLGPLIAEPTTAELGLAIDRLLEPAQLAGWQRNARDAYSEYSWPTAERRLQAVYAALASH